MPKTIEHSAHQLFASNLSLPDSVPDDAFQREDLAGRSDALMPETMNESNTEMRVWIISLKKAVNRILRKFGLRLSRVSSNDVNRFVSGLKEHRIDVVLDVGANAGQFAQSIRNADFDGQIVCFEPLPDAHRKLRKRFSQDEKTLVHERTALGDERGSIQMNVSRNSVSSSILPILPSHSDAAPDSAYVDTIDTAIDRLDNLFDRYVGENQRAFLKIDTQGYEWNVLDGAEKSLSRIDGLLLEMSIVRLYEGQRLWHDILDRLEREGFVLWQILPGFSDPETGRTLQFDGVLYRDENV